MLLQVKPCLQLARGKHSAMLLLLLLLPAPMPPLLQALLLLMAHAEQVHAPLLAGT
jgi:hypothetical protein